MSDIGLVEERKGLEGAFGRLKTLEWIQKGVIDFDWSGSGGSRLIKGPYVFPYIISLEKANI